MPGLIYICLQVLLIFHVFIYFLQVSVFHSYVFVAGYLYGVTWSVSEVRPQPLQVCQENSVPMMSYTRVHALLHVEPQQ